MVTTSLLKLKVGELLVRAEKLTGVKFPRDIIEVSLEPKLNMLCIRFMHACMRSGTSLDEGLKRTYTWAEKRLAREFSTGLYRNADKLLQTKTEANI